ncbi:MAG: molybdate ABC transporter substrate-binding protein [Aulosira sp. DedQUE10]|nr:molybdate ABC transporter substrate-binding protein [Aulosira sp. DedQUE10]
MKRMIRLGALFSLVAALCIWLGSCTTSQANPVALNVAAAGLFREVLVEIDRIRQPENPGVVVNYTIAGSEVLKRRIEQGESFDLVIASSPKPMDELEQKGLILSETRQPFVATQIALITPADSQLPLSNFKDLTGDRVKTVAMSLEGPGVSTYTNEILTNLKILQPLRAKAVLAKTDVREILNAVETGRADAGITFLSEARRSDKVKIVATASPDLHRPVVTTLAVLKKSQHATETKQLVEFFKSQQAMAVFQQNGFELPRS